MHIGSISPRVVALSLGVAAAVGLVAGGAGLTDRAVRPLTAARLRRRRRQPLDRSRRRQGHVVEHARPERDRSGRRTRRHARPTSGADKKPQEAEETEEAPTVPGSTDVAAARRARRHPARRPPHPPAPPTAAPSPPCRRKPRPRRSARTPPGRTAATSKATPSRAGQRACQLSQALRTMSSRPSCAFQPRSFSILVGSAK